MLDAIILDLGNVLAFHDNELLFANMAKAFKTSPEAMRARLDGGLWDRVNRGHLSGELLLNELNTMPGQTATSVYGALWGHSGLEYPALMDELCRIALARGSDASAHRF